METSTKIIKNVKNMVSDESFIREQVFEREKDFTRNRKLSFHDTVMFVLGNTRQSLELAALDFCDESGKESVSAAAICKSRAKIKFGAFKRIFSDSVAMIPCNRKYQDYQLLAVDGMDGELPKTAILLEKYKRGKDVGYPMFHAVAAYDVLNDYFAAAYFDSESGDERKAAITLLDETCFDENKQIFLFDRGFPSIALLQKLEQRGKKYVMRVSSSFLKEVNEFTASKTDDKTISIHYTSRRGQLSRVYAKLPYDFELRCVRIHLSSGEDEICVTNLDKTAFPKRRIKELYGLRWGIESGFNFLKNSIFVEEFTSKSENGIKQDFYSSLWCANMINLMIVEAFEVKKRKNEKTEL